MGVVAVISNAIFCMNEAELRSLSDGDGDVGGCWNLVECYMLHRREEDEHFWMYLGTLTYLSYQIWYR